ncbi:5-formyltetrahydrofolate cyclo-ligase [Candidatus Manganitrophus noduliformans]|uniref:5-formyltetrahydrofolate cyclo-ligase n=1 Tax=Candidatus Manganitrophus noduliformans TaxID=2606439 RepID=A0A7X6DNH6_9BACT|nr:5-formyltetrahydrofolate cyclo-ligase [Candidatus Manganitrophus noduliformans]NKE70367.1 5-formyltetrahydrofolate cyclo-ligase [Candidatus Manganitrophus noduliformans]
MGHFTDKKEIRAGFLLQRKALSSEECRLKSGEIAKRFLASSEFNAAQTIHFYLAMAAEVQTDEMIREALRMKKRVVVPLVQPETKSLALSELIELHPSKLQPGPYGISEPRLEYRKKVDPKEVELWVVPGVAFDETGNRLGFGGGYYDRLLSSARGRKVGMAFEFQVLNQLPIEETDHPVDLIMTEKRTIYIQGDESAGETN